MSTEQPAHQKRLRFVDEYLIDLNGAEAAVRAGYSAKRAKQTAYDLLQRDDVQAAITAKQAARSQEAGDRATRAAAELEAIGFMDLGSLKDAPPAAVNVKRAALVDLLKLDGILKERFEHSGPNGGPIPTEEKGTAAAKVVHDLGEIFGAAALAVAAAVQPRADDTVVHKSSDRGRSKKPGAPAAS